MEYKQTLRLRDGRLCVLRNGTAEDGQAVLDIFRLTHMQTDHLLTYPEEMDITPEQEGDFLRKKAESLNEVELLAEVEGRLVGTAGIACVCPKEKTRHRAELGISVERDFWGLGVGRALMEGCIACAVRAGYAQLELSVFSDNERALALYRSLGFVEFGRNPRGFRSRTAGYQELVYMRLEL